MASIRHARVLKAVMTATEDRVLNAVQSLSMDDELGQKIGLDDVVECVRAVASRVLGGPDSDVAAVEFLSLSLESMSASHDLSQDRTESNTHWKSTVLARLRVCTTQWANAKQVSAHLFDDLQRTGLSDKNILKNYALLRLAALEKRWDELLKENLVALAALYAEHT